MPLRTTVCPLFLSLLSNLVFASDVLDLERLLTESEKKYWNQEIQYTLNCRSIRIEGAGDPEVQQRYSAEVSCAFNGRFYFITSDLHPLHENYDKARTFTLWERPDRWQQLILGKTRDGVPYPAYLMKFRTDWQPFSSNRNASGERPMYLSSELEHGAYDPIHLVLLPSAIYQQDFIKRKSLSTEELRQLESGEEVRIDLDVAGCRPVPEVEYALWSQVFRKVGESVVVARSEFAYESTKGRFGRTYSEQIAEVADFDPQGLPTSGYYRMTKTNLQLSLVSINILEWSSLRATPIPNPDRYFQTRFDGLPIERTINEEEIIRNRQAPGRHSRLMFHGRAFPDYRVSPLLRSRHLARQYFFDPIVQTLPRLLGNDGDVPMQILTHAQPELS